ncbi:MAG: hybrid sensor histidine kinase/response regulator [Verrucomicrobia bacterium]|nr:MAG: hybrid sensor histidine kinase/response regulator [Verrucomicrobiota bacterium]
MQPLNDDFRIMKKILVVDDEEWLREMVQMALQHKGFDVRQANNGQEGVEAARKELPDLVLCDVNMGQMDGYQTLAALRSEQATASIPFILMTGAADNSGMRQGMELGADDYLPKPFTIDALYGAVDARLKKSQLLHQQAERKLADLRDNISLMLPHEMRTPLNGILSFGELLATEAATLPPADVAEMGQVICDSGKRLQRLIENFLIYAQLELLTADPHKVSALRRSRTEHPRPIIERTAKELAEAAGRGSDLALNLADAPMPISEEYLVKIVGELVQNAFKFSPKGSPVQVGLSESSHLLILSVSDQGKGFPTEHVSKVGAYMQFDRRLHEQQGLGLGLSITKRLTELHDGSLSIQNGQERGTFITVKLPKETQGPIESNGSN